MGHSAKTPDLLERSLQAFNFMRVPRGFLPHVRRAHVVEALRRNPELTRGLYRTALEEVMSNSHVMAATNHVAWALKRNQAGKVSGWSDRGVAGVKRQVWQLFHRDDEFPAAEMFNETCLNGKGEDILMLSLIFDAMNMNPASVDSKLGHAIKHGAYAPRETRPHGRLGRWIQFLIKEHVAVDEDRMQEAADRYIVFRFICDGNLQSYMEYADVKSNSREEKYYRTHFNAFDRAIGFPKPKLGRKTNEERQRGWGWKVARRTY